MEKLQETLDGAVRELNRALDRADHEAAHIYAQIIAMVHHVIMNQRETL